MRYQIDHLSNGPWVGSEEATTYKDTKEAFPRALDDIWTGNSVVPEPVEACVHGLIKRSVCERPAAPAVCSWDGELTYRELDQLSSKLAHQLADLGVGPGTMVIQCFEKSVLAPVAMLGVMKAGGASVALDITQPEDQLRIIAAQVSAPFILCSAVNEHLARQISAGEVIVVDRDLSGPSSATKLRHELPLVSPSDVLCVIFTSGCTGAPKGAVLTHRNYSSSIIYQQKALSFTSSSRVFDHASYASHVAWSNLLHTLTCGGCLCVPSEADRRSNIEGSMVALQANYAQFTPTIARTLDLSSVPALAQLNYIGEPATPLEPNELGRQVAVLNVYGSSEVASLATLWVANEAESREPLIGPRGGMCAWVVDANNPEALAPFGTAGELWLEGPLVGQGYFNDGHKTAAAFVEDPAWLLRGAPKWPGRHGRAYRTGDLVRYREDGQLVFVGRKEQAKVQDQLVDLGEVEHQMRRAVAPSGDDIENLQLIAETIQPQGADTAILVAFVAFDSARDMTDEEYGKAAHLATVGLTDELAKTLPQYMVPAAYIPIQAVPMTATGKVDRHCLRSIGSLLTDEEISRLRGGGRHMPQSETEHLMQALWAQVLVVEPGSIGRDADFFSIGGDATKALRLSRLASKSGLFFTAREVFQSPCLRDLSALAISPTLPSASAIPPLSLLERPMDESEVRAHAAHHCHVQEAQILDILPCTPLQAGLLALTARQSGAYVARNVFELGSDIDADGFRAAWDQVVALNPILRTRIVSLPHHGVVQVVLEEGAQWSAATRLDDLQRDGGDVPMGLGVPLTRFALVGEDGGSRCFVWDIHHALYDGWSLPLLLQEAEHAYYRESSPPLEPMTAFIKYIVEREETATKAFWHAQFANLKGAHFPLPKTATYTARPDCQLSLAVPGLKWGRGDVTPATMVRAAWAVMVAHSADSDEALFGLTVTGRQAAIPGIERMAGPAIATVPLRVALDWEDSVGRLLGAVQRQAVEMIPHEQTGLQRIRRVSEAAAVACGFQSLLVIQPGSGDGGDSATPARPFLTEPRGDDHHAAQWQDFSTYAIVVECQLEADEVRVRIGFDSSVVGQQQMGRIARSFERVLRQLADGTRSKEKLAAVIMPSLCHASVEDIWAWNAKVPAQVDDCVHNLVTQRARDHPLAPAVCAWDGELTYAQLDELSTRLAYRLADAGVAGTVVPLFFDKSVWMPVAALAVMKAGGASIAMETSQPEERLRGIAAQANSPVVVASMQRSDLARRLVTKEVVTVGPGAQESPPESKRRALPAVTPSSVLYVVFTSGSTGTPKGAIVTHGNFCSSIVYQQKQMGYNDQSRVFDFASYAFDASWWNLLHALTAGGCLCIPSAKERENDLAACIEKYRVTTADLTPSVARFLGPKVLSSLSTLVLGGEAVLPSDAHLAGDNTQIINVYGPAECTPAVTFAHVTLDPITIGRGAGVCTWVVQVDDHDSLAPIGAVGELWVEGPLVGQGYLNDAEKTAAAFVQDPAWLTRGAPGHEGRSGRVYRTGDLVRYRDDGSLLFVGRKDTQVKIRGQRIELGEVEHHVRQAMESVEGVDVTNAQVTAETIQPAGASSAILIAFINLDLAAVTSEDSHNAAVKKVTDGLADRLAQTLPVFMVPSAYIPVHKIPMMTTGKTDRRQLRTIGAESWLKYRGVSGKNEPDETLTEVEKLLQKVWMTVLNLTAEEASVSKAFTRLGGDSISAMQVVSQCRLHNLSFTASDVLQAGTIRKLAARCQFMSQQEPLTESDEEKADREAFDLSPIQQMFFDVYPEGLNHYNQGFILDLGQPVPVETLRRACRAIVNRHAMLRARYSKDPEDGRWKQSILGEDDEESYAFSAKTVASRAEVTDAAQWRQGNIDIREGPVFACDVFQIDGGDQVLVLSAHHLVIDLVSWRIVWSDIEDFVKLGELRSQKPTSFRTWCRRQARVGSSLSPLSVLPFTVPKAELEFWGLPQSKNTFGNCNNHTEVFERETSTLLLADGNESLRTEPIDLMVAAIVYSFHKSFPDRPLPVVWVEGHGREQSNDLPLDVSETVGWFTTMHPLPVPITSESSVLDAVRLAKDTRRKVPNKGQPYFACRYHSASGREAFQGHEVAEITLNFTGRYQQLESEESLFGRSEQPAEAERSITEVSETASRTAMIEVNAGVEEGNLSVSFCFHKDMKHQDRLQQWTEESFYQTIKSLASQLKEAPVSFTLCDLPLVHLSYRGLDTLLKEQLPSMGIKPHQVVDIYPCSPLQEGILLSSFKGAATYDTYSVYRCLPSEPATSAISPSKMEAAWRRVVPRHTILSTVFSMHPEGSGFLQIVLSNPKVRVTQITTTQQQSPTAALCKLERPTFSPSEPQHELTICRSETGEVAIRLDVSHALIDAYSMSVLVQELTAAYDDCGLPPAPAFGDMVRFIDSTPKTQRVAAWTSLLDGVEPCVVPVSQPPPGEAFREIHSDVSVPTNLVSNITEFCKEIGITRATFLQVAWSMALSQFTGMREVCFGYLASGRDAPVDKIEAMVGPLANLLISRIDLQASARQVLETASERSIQHLAMQHASLAEIQHHLGLSGQRLFNTSLSIREADKLKGTDARTFSFENDTGEDPHEYDLSLSANIDGNKMDIVMEFREPYINKQVAREACTTLNRAIEYLLDAGGNSGGTETLFGGFFKHIVGADETAATDFWRDQFANVQGSHFPSLKTASYHPRPDSCVELSMLGLDWQRSGFSAAAMIRAAWSVVTARSMGSNETIFGAAVNGGEAASAVVPVRVRLDWESNTRQLLQDVQSQAAGMAPFERTGLPQIRRVSDEAALACDFKSLLVVYPANQASTPPAAVNGDRKCWKGTGSHALVVELRPGADGAIVSLSFDSNCVGEAQVSRILHQFQHVLYQLMAVDGQGSDRLRDVTVVSQRDLDDIWTWNATVPEAIEACVHDLIETRAAEHPLAPAISAWDGDLTYGQLSELSSRLAHQLAGKGVGPGSIVPLCFEKSMWMPVAALAVMKAGGASVAIDSTQPEERIRAITSQVRTEKPLVILSSVANAELVQKLEADEVVVVGLDRLPDSLPERYPDLPPVSPSEILYVVFTSGSTGRPKGAIITHRNFYSAIVYQRDDLGYHRDSRVFDFASYAFDIAWSNLLNTLTVGACLCIPSAAERENNLPGCLEKYKITVSDLTPSVARFIEPKSALHNLTTLLLGGEVVLPSDALLVPEDTLVVSAYGPAECTPTSTILHLKGNSEMGIGRAAGLCTWVVDIDNPEALAPIGAIGELWLEGPLVGKGYLNEPEKTAAAFIQDPSWLKRGAPGTRAGRGGLVYRTGDLVQYKEDGTLLFIGRKDTQVKIRGQRVELGEVEHHVLQAVKAAEPAASVQIIAETIQPSGAESKILVAFVALDNAKDLASEEYDDAVRQLTTGLNDRLAEALPVFMLPSAYIPIQTVPMMTTGKADRRQLRGIGSALSAKDIAKLSRVDGDRRAPRTDTERIMQTLWAEVLNIEPESIGIDDSFFRIGGDSIGAMRLVGNARNRGLALSVRDVFQNPILRDLATLDNLDASIPVAN
ncbi:AMP-binding enzyme [Hirsutella rhossiliensis]|uniref:AMP-binding enzyme domain-containing protein n=1 Tax=Hirsutella rhossiliensis TaxID=111463 RepID=A0A9P8MQ05_9HYPO|nr:AMP-binding enzyme domain-containing protein [Hirsutella rhossiliensis]KAH0960163.1 AMP-binding enzyme domain-containing protein [Hirsutella rhossiliensis]